MDKVCYNSRTNVLHEQKLSIQRQENATLYKNVTFEYTELALVLLLIQSIDAVGIVRRGYRSVANSANLHKARCGLFLRTTSTNSEHLFYRRGRVVYDVTEVRRSCSLRAPRCIESIDRDA
eukprot:scaffold13349_cov195-Alexandrium_tamarense.AAC.2